MPYIPKKDRKKFEDAIEILIDELYDNGGLAPSYQGQLNYIISSLIWKIFDEGPSYTMGNNLVGVLECVKQEFLRRRLNDYEDQKIIENGDIQ